MTKKRIIITFLVICLVFVLGFKALFKSITLIPIRFFSVNCSQAIYFFDTEKKLIALTINNVPDNNHIFPNTTLGILDVLARYEAKATFFVNIDKATEFPALITSIVKQGHELGNYLADRKLGIGLGNKFETKFVRADRFLSQFAATSWFRPNSKRCNFDINRTIAKYDYKTALGLVMPDSLGMSPQFYNQYIKQNIRPGAVLILDDSNNDDQRGQEAIAVLNTIIPQLQQQGYHFVTLSELEHQK